jgi:uncharacterized protein HemX
MTEPSMPSIENKITTGNILTIAALVVAMGVAWGTMQAQLVAMRDRVVTIEVQADRSRAERQAAMADQEIRLRAVEASQARSDERFNSVLQILGRIEARLERIESR